MKRYEELKARLRSYLPLGDGSLWSESSKDIARSVEAIEQLQRQLAERDAEIAKCRDAPVVWIHSSHLAQAQRQIFLCRVAPDKRDGYKPLIVKPGEQ